MARNATILAAGVLLLLMQSAHGQSPLPPLLSGVWFTLVPDNLQSNVGGEQLTQGDVGPLCELLSRNPAAPHNFEGVLVFHNSKMISWHGECSLSSVKQSNAGTFSGRGHCAGEHGSSHVSMVLVLKTRGDQTNLTVTSTDSEGFALVDTFDQRCP